MAPTPTAGVPAASGTSTFSIVGTTTSHDRVALILDRLALLPWLSNVALQSSTRSGNSDSFTIGRYLKRRSWLMIDRMSGRVSLLLVSVALILIVLLGWFVLIAPQRSKAATLDSQVSDTNVQLQAVTSLLEGPVGRQSLATLRASQTAVPDDAKMSADSAPALGGGSQGRSRARWCHSQALIPVQGAEVFRSA